MSDTPSRDRFGRWWSSHARPDASVGRRRQEPDERRYDALVLVDAPGIDGSKVLGDSDERSDQSAR